MIIARKCLSAIILMITIMGCETMYSYEYVVNNETSYHVLIEGFDRISAPYDSNISKETIDIDPYGSYSVFKGMGFHAEDPGIFQSNQIDSVNIIFDKKKIILQFCNEVSLEICYDIARNITGYDVEYEKVKTGRSSGENEYRYTYTITEEDYNNAVPIEE